MINYFTLSNAFCCQIDQTNFWSPRVNPIKDLLRKQNQECIWYSIVPSRESFWLLTHTWADHTLQQLSLYSYQFATLPLTISNTLFSSLIVKPHSSSLYINLSNLIMFSLIPSSYNNIIGDIIYTFTVSNVCPIIYWNISDAEEIPNMRRLNL